MTSQPTISNECYNDLLSAKRDKQMVFIIDNHVSEGACPNCGGAGYNYFQFSTGGPYKYVPTGKDAIKFDTSTNQYYTVETRSYPCPACNDIKAKQNIRWQQSNLDLVARAYTLEFYDPYPAKKFAVANVKQMCQLPVTGWLTLHGGYGVGKTGLLKYAVKWAVEQGITATYVTANQLLAMVRATYGENNVSEMDLYTKFRGYKLLAIDEVDRISSTDWAMSTLFTILDQRYTASPVVATLIATNANPETMGDKWGYLVSRMRDGEIVHVGGPELRGAK